MAEDLARQKGVLLSEMHHRVANSLQIIASILMIKARSVESQETRTHLQDAHRRVLSMAVVQQHLHDMGGAELISILPYLSKLCSSLSQSIIGDHRWVSVKVEIATGETTSLKAASLGLIVTELVINAVKHAFPDKKRPGHIKIRYETNENSWRLQVIDDGVGLASSQQSNGQPTKGGLGTTLVSALAQHLGGTVGSESGPHGTTVSVSHAEFMPRAPVEPAMSREI